MEANAVKETGNQFFKEKKYGEAAACYTRALELSSNGREDTAERSIYYKNRAACYLKLSEYEKATEDCLSALKISPNDSKSLYRYAQALEGAGKEAESLVQLKKLLSVDSKNREANEMARRLVASLKKSSERLQSADALSREMYKRLSDPGGGADQRIQSAKNLAVLSHQEGGAEEILRTGGVARLVPHLRDDSPELVNHILQVFVGLVTNSSSRSVEVFKKIQLERLSCYISSTHSNVAMSAIAILKEIVLSLTPLTGEASKGAEPGQLSPLVLPIVQLMFISLAKGDVLGDARDGVLEFFAKTVPGPGMPRLYVGERLVEHVLRVSTHAWAELEQEMREEGITEIKERLPVSENCRMNVSMVLSVLHSNIQGRNDKDLRDSFKEQSKGFISSRISMTDVYDCLGTLSALSCLLMGAVEIGNEIFSEGPALQLAIKMAESPDSTCQGMAAEVLTLAASDKSRCQELMDKGVPALKSLYHSSDDRVQVKALVGLCRVGSSGGGATGPFAEGATLKLEKTCRKYLVGAKKGEGLRKWAAEGIAFLSLDAEVKEALVKDEPALKVLFRLVGTPDKSLLYGIASTLVNLTNSYDKPERNPELEELGKFAGENVPKEHEKDRKEYVEKRVGALLKMGVVAPLNELGSSESAAIREQVSRVFLALVEDAGNRGSVIQQGGVRTLISLSLDGTPKGKLFASQALAKIGITNNPQLAFPGQRMLEVVRPMVQLLKSEKGLQQFEGLMALTNLASMGEDVRLRILREGAVPLMEGLMFEEEELIRRASTEALCNMIQMDEVRDRFHGDDLERVKLWTLFSGEEDEKLSRAASGGLAQLSHDPKICAKIMEVKSAKEILKELVTKESEELKFRGMYILANLVEASREIAEVIVKDEFLEVFMAYLQGDAPPNVKEQAERALRKAVEYGLIMANPDIISDES